MIAGFRIGENRSNLGRGSVKILLLHVIEEWGFKGILEFNVHGFAPEVYSLI